MLERFHVPHDIAVKVNHKEIFDVVKNIFLKMGMSDEDARIKVVPNSLFINLIFFRIFFSRLSTNKTP